VSRGEVGVEPKWSMEDKVYGGTKLNCLKKQTYMSTLNNKLQGESFNQRRKQRDNIGLDRRGSIGANNELHIGHQ